MRPTLSQTCGQGMSEVLTTWLTSLKLQPASHFVEKPGPQKPWLQQDSKCVCVSLCVCVCVRGSSRLCCLLLEMEHTWQKGTLIMTARRHIATWRERKAWGRGCWGAVWASIRQRRLTELSQWRGGPWTLSVRHHHRDQMEFQSLRDEVKVCFQVQFRMQISSMLSFHLSINVGRMLAQKNATSPNLT